MEKFFYFVSEEWLLVGVLATLVIVYFLYNNLHKAKRKSAQQVVFAMNQEDKDIVLLDIRDSKDFHKAHIVGAVNYPAKAYDDVKDKVAPYREKQIIVICNAGVSAEPIATGLLDDGMEAFVLDGGMENWLRLGFPVKK